MTPRKFDRYMVAISIGTHPKLGELSDGEFRAHVAGVLAVAAMAPVRGLLMVGALPAKAVHVARAAGVSKTVAQSAIDKLVEVGILERDDEHECLRVHDWEDYNPPPKADYTAAERQARHRAKVKAEGARPIDKLVERDGAACRNCGAHDDLTVDHVVPRSRGGSNEIDNLQILCRPCNSGKQDRDGPSKGLAETLRRERDKRDRNTELERYERDDNGTTGVTVTIPPPHPPLEGEGEVEVEDPPYPPQGGTRQANQDVLRLCKRLAARMVANDPKAKPTPDSDRWRRDMRLLLRDRQGDIAEVERIIDWCQHDSFWQSNILSPAKLRKQFTQLLLRAQQPSSVVAMRQRPNASEMLRAINGGAA